MGAGGAAPTAMVLGAVASVQSGAALAATLFGQLGPGGTVLLRMGFAALALGAVWRPRVRGVPPPALRLAALFGLALAGMNLSFYLALDRIPLGIAVTFEFVGPLAVAVVASRRALDVAWAALAAAGVLLLSGGVGGDLDVAGVAFALTAGCLWAAYILLGAGVGRRFRGGRGLALAMAVGTAALAPVGAIDGGPALLRAQPLLLGAAVALLSSAIPYSLELEALRRIPARVFGVLMSLEPAMAAVAGYVVLGQRLGGGEALAIGLVVVASAGASAGAARSGRADRATVVDPL